MPAQKEYKTDRVGVFYILGRGHDGRDERIYYIRFKRDKKLIVEKAGRASAGMTPAKAARIRAAKIEGKLRTNKEKREAARIQKKEEDGRPTISRLWALYLEQRPGLKSMATDRSRFEKYIEPPFGDRIPEEIASLDVDRIRVRLLKTKAPATVRNVLELLRRIVNFGVRMQLCDAPGFSIQMPELDNIKTEDLSAEQLNALIKAIDEDYDINIQGIMRMALFTGMRRGELFRLEWRDLDFQRGFINIRDPKGGKSQSIPMNDTARKILETHPRTESPYVFPGRSGGQLTDCIKGLNRVKTKAGLPKDFRPLHGLRHLYATMLASSGQVDLFTLQKLLTHKSPLMTQRYAHLRDEALRKASNLAGALVDKALKEANDQDGSGESEVCGEVTAAGGDNKGKVTRIKRKQKM